jgi:hypothetical protein
LPLDEAAVPPTTIDQSIRWQEVTTHWRKEILRRHQQLRQSIPAFVRTGSLRNLVTLPLVYSLGLPLLLLDLWVSAYQAICFPLYGIARVSRSRYFVFDRHRLVYLNGIEKLHCAYCSYAIGVLSYVSEVGARTEQYWCPIKHAKPNAAPHDHYQLFFDYGDAERYHHELADMRRALRGRTPGRDRPRAIRRHAPIGRATLQEHP